ncbi:hypothetical protein MKW92_046067 [Papaver armeniacum]|nr:hypothetical protein MKW92_046067 [Papaver armeniacum]
MRRTLQKTGASSSLYSCRQHSPSANPIPKPNPSLSLPHSSSSSALFNRVPYNRVFVSKTHVHPYYFYCDTEDFKEMLIEYKSGNRKMYPYIFEALTARHSEHGEDDKKLMKELGVLSQGDDKKEVHRENCARRDEAVTGDSRAFSRLVASTISIVITENKLFSSRFMIKERVGGWPPNPYGIRTGGKVTYALGRPDNIEVKCCIIPLSHYLVQNKARKLAAHGRSLLLDPGSLD